MNEEGIKKHLEKRISREEYEEGEKMVFDRNKKREEKGKKYKKWTNEREIKRTENERKKT